MNLLELQLDETSYLAQVVYGNMADDAEYERNVSTKDVERLLEFQIGELQSMLFFFVLMHKRSNDMQDWVEEFRMR